MSTTGYLEETLPKVEKKIRPLVEGLIKNGIVTSDSCEGHIGRGRHYASPQVGIELSVSRSRPGNYAPETLEKLATLIGEWNATKKGGSPWILFPIFIPFTPTTLRFAGLSISLSPLEQNYQEDPEILLELQEEARKLGEFLIAKSSQ